MLNKYYYLILLFLIAFTACEEEIIYNSVVPSIGIILPVNNFIVREYDSVLIQIKTNVDESSIETIELYCWSKDFFEDTLVNILTQKPYEKYIVIPKICVENTNMFLKASVKLKASKKVNSEVVGGAVLKDILPNDEVDVYDYKAFDNDSNLVANGTISFYIRNNSDILGRKNIIPIIPDSAFESGVGFIEGLKSYSSYGDYFIKMNVCYFISAQGYLFIGLHGNIEGNRFYGDRYLSSFDPTTIKIGTFTALKRE